MDGGGNRTVNAAGSNSAELASEKRDQHDQQADHQFALHCCQTTPVTKHRLIVVLLLVFGLAAAACASLDAETMEAGTGDQAGDSVDSGPDSGGSDQTDGADAADETTVTPPDVSDLPATNIQLDPCGDLLCGVVTAPIDYVDESLGTVEIPINIHVANRPRERVGYLLINPGGPGQPGLEIVEDAPLYFSDEILDVFDIVGFDPRGVGAATPAFGCGAPGQQQSQLNAIDGYVDQPDEVPLAEAAVALCAETMGPLASRLGTEFVARDMDEIRKALGVDQISYIGFSYGSTIGAFYATMFPESVRAMVLDGADNPDDDVSTLEARYESGLAEVSQFEQLLGDALAACTTAVCPIYNNGDPVAYYREAVKKLDLVNAAVNNNPSAGVLGVITTLYSEDTWPLLWDALYLLQDRDDPSYFAEFARFQVGEDDVGSVTAYVNCLDGWALAPELDRETQLADGELLEERYAAALPLLYAMNLETPETCPFFDQFSPPAFDGVLDGGDVEVMVIGNRSDPATPFTESVEMFEMFNNGILVETDHSAHVVYPSNECVNAFIHDALIRLEFPSEKRVTCARED